MLTVLVELLEPRSLFAASGVVAASSKESALRAEVSSVWTFALSQIESTLKALPASGEFPSYTNASGKWVEVPATDWTSGFFAGELWEAYKESGSRVLEKAAIKLTSELTPQDSAEDDLAFRFLPTVGMEYQFTGNISAEQVLVAAAASKIKAFDPPIGLFRSVDGWASTSGNPLANFDVLIDHTMDIQLVYRDASLAGNSDWIKMANQNMQKLETTLVRPDGSTYQWGYFNDQDRQLHRW